MRSVVAAVVGGVLEEIRSGALNRDVPVIIVSIAAGNLSAARFQVREVLSKPVDPADLLAALAGEGVTRQAALKRAPSPP
jgi:CheY-like chemotaxis protein